jgi:hypothetical protein
MKSVFVGEWISEEPEEWRQHFDKKSARRHEVPETVVLRSELAEADE